MKIFLTGRPGSGKTTLLADFLDKVPNKQGFLTKEVLQNGSRIGFELISSSGQTGTLASIKSKSAIRVSKYGVEVGELNKFLATLPSINPGSLLYIDEIGQMELFSDQFQRLVEKYLGSGNHFVGTISSIYHDEFIQQILNRDDIVLLEISSANRQQIKDALLGLAANLKLLKNLSPDQEAVITKMARAYSRNQEFIQLKKLFNNTIKYVAENKVEPVDSNSFTVHGNTKDHQVIKEAEWSCDCDLFNNKGQFEGRAGECSHIQAAKLTTL